MKLLQRGVALALLTTFTLASETALAYEQDKTYKITVLHTNDHHGHFWRNEYGEYGLAAQKTLVDGIRKEVAAEGGSVLLLSGGDINTGVPESDLQDAEPDFRGMNLVAMTRWRSVIMNLIIRSPYYASRKSGPSSRCFPRISTRKVLASACLNRGRCLSVRI